MNQSEVVSSLLQRIWHLIADVLLGAPVEGWVVIIGLIIPIFTWSARSVLRHHSNILRERESLSLQRQQIQNLTHKDQLTEHLRRLHTRGDLETDTERMLASLYWVTQLDSVEPESLLAPTIQKWENGLKQVRSAPNWLLLSGLLGTVAGLSMTVGTLNPQISSAAAAVSPEQLADALTNTLSSMQSAFACTIWGILAALSVSWLLRRTSTEQSNLVVDLWQLVMHEIAPQVMQRREDILLNDLREAVSSGCNLLSQAASEVTTLNRHFKSEIEQITKSLADYIGNLRHMLSSVLEEAQKAATMLSKKAEEAAVALSSGLSQMEDTSRSFSSEISAALRRLSEQHSKLMDAQKVVAESYDNAQRRLEEYITKQINDTHNLANTIGQTGASIVTQVGHNTAKTQSVVEELMTISQELRNHLGELQTIGSRLAQYVAVAQKFEENMPFMTSFAQKWQEISEAITTIVGLQEQRFEPVMRQHDSVTPQLQALQPIASILEKQQQVSQANAAALSEVSALLQNLVITLQQHQKTVDDLSNKLQKLSSIIEQVVKDGRERSTSITPTVAIIPDEAKEGSHTKIIRGKTTSRQPFREKLMRIFSRRTDDS